jgi:sulfide dehydrogenase cytochrome subunit
MTKLFNLSLAAGLLVSASLLFADQSQAENNNTVAENTSTTPMIDIMAHTCAGCHGTNGVAGDSAFMPLAGMPSETFIQTMLDFRNDTRPSTLMGHVAKGFTEEDIKAMATFFENLSPEGKPLTAQEGDAS